MLRLSVFRPGGHLTITANRQPCWPEHHDRFVAGIRLPYLLKELAKCENAEPPAHDFLDVDKRQAHAPHRPYDRRYPAWGVKQHCAVFCCNHVSRRSNKMSALGPHGFLLIFALAPG